MPFSHDHSVRERARQLRTDGRHLKDIARELNVSVATVSRWTSKDGVAKSRRQARAWANANRQLVVKRQRNYRRNAKLFPDDYGNGAGRSKRSSIVGD